MNVNYSVIGISYYLAMKLCSLILEMYNVSLLLGNSAINVDLTLLKLAQLCVQQLPNLVFSLYIVHKAFTEVVKYCIPLYLIIPTE